MSTWASKVEEIRCAKSPTFCVSHNQWIADTLNILAQLSDDGSGLVWVGRERVEGALELLELDEAPYSEKEEIRVILEAIIEDMGTENCVEYLCG